MAGFLAASFMLFLTGVLRCCSAEVIYVKPTPTTPCWQTPCQTLSHYLHPPINFSAVTEIVFLPGTHTLDSDINIATHANFTITGNTTSLPRIVSTIVCSDMHWITFSGVMLLKINAIEFQACGTNIGFGTVLLFSVEYSEFKNVSFQHNIDSAIFVLSSTLYIADSHFRNNSAVSDGGAIRIIHSTVMFSGTNYFTDNNSNGGALAAGNSTVMFSGANYFSNNFNHDGGVIAVINCTVVFSGTNRFTNNSYYYGGVIGAVNTTVMFSGTNYFTNNSAVSIGGVIIQVVSSTIMFSGTNSFTNNSNGGVIGALNATVMLSGTNYFTNNSAVFAGGALRVITSTVMFSGTNHFTNNSAKKTGGAIYSSGCKLDFVGYNIFVGNTAEDSGGIKCTSSTLNMSGTVIFTNNSAASDGSLDDKAVVNSTDQDFSIGGAIGGVNSIFLFDVTNIVFSQNKADFGSILHCSLCVLHFHRNQTFIENKAYYDGGIFIIQTELTFKGTTTFSKNQAIHGAGIFASQSNLTSDGITTLSKNQALSGAGIHADEAIIALKGTSNFIHNIAGNQDAAITLFLSSCISEGVLNIANNLANSTGGISVARSTLEIHGKCVFSENTVPAVLVLEGSAMFIGVSTFSRHNSLVGISVITTLNSTLLFRGNTTFASNTGSFAAGITVLISDVQFSGINTFYNNSGGITGSTLFVGFDSSLELKGTNIFLSNTAESGSAISVIASIFNMEGITNITNNVITGVGRGTIYSLQSKLTIAGKCSFSENSAHRGAGMAIFSSILNLTGYTEFINNYASLLAAGLYAENSTVTVTGTCIFRENNADQQGGAIYLDTTMFHLQGNVTLQKNSARQGGGLFLARNSHLQFGSNLQLIATENSADYGGAIYIEDVVSFAECIEDEQNSTEAITCFFPDNTMPAVADFLNSYFGECPQDRENVLPPGPADCALKFPMGEKSEIELVFEHNSASEAGTILFGGKLDRCTENASTTTFSLFTELAVLITNDTITSVISSEPLLICPCVSGIPHCESRTSYISVIPGEAFQLSAVAVGQGNGSIPTTIRSYFELHNETAEIGDGEHTQTTGKQCTDIMYTIFSSQNSETLFLYPDGPCRDVGIAKHTVHVSILPCPHAFELMNSMCTCEKRIRSFTNSCNVSDDTIQRSDGSNFWLALSRNESNHYEGVILHPHCPLDYCKTGSVRINLSDTSSQCAFNRSGILCGSCRQNLSAVFGSSQCLPCSNAYLALILPFAIAGFVLVFFILICKMTVAVGTVNGLIFYANIVSSNRHIFVPHGDTNILTIFIAWLNLDIGIETCFYDGMDVYTKTWLQFVFPLYVWGIIGFIIFISKYSPRITRLLGRNPVAVLATLFLLSYAKILRALIVTFSVAFLEYPDESKVAVWLYDGNISYLHGKHIPLFATSLLMLFIFLPYTFLLVFSQWLQVKSHKRILSWMNSTKFRAFIDAYHAPYKPKYRYWTGLLLIVRCALFITFALNFSGDSSTNLLSIVTVSSVLAVIPWLKGRVYNSWCLNALEVSFFLNLSILSVATYHVRLTGGNQAAVTYTSISVTFISFIGVLIYHSYTQLKESCICKLCIKDEQRVPKETSHTQKGDRQPESATISVLNLTELREPLMGDKHLN